MVGPFRVRRVLASGTLGPRLLVEDDRGRLQVLKLITEATDDADALAGLLEQVRVTLPSHPALLPITEVGVSDEGVYLASPVVNAPSVEGRLRGGRQTLDATLQWLRAVSGGLHAAHEAGVHHGAIHPRDVLVTDDGGILTGAGIAPMLEHLQLQAPVRVPFTAPERASGRHWDARADQYSLAMLALDALSGRRLIAGTIPAFDRWTLAETPTEDARLHEVFVRALHPDPEQRYPSLMAWCAALAGPEHEGESGALSRFAREGVILASPAAAADAPREIKVQTVEDPDGVALSLFPQEDATIESPLAGTEALSDGPHVEPRVAEAEQEWLVADVPEEGTGVEPDVDRFVMGYAPAAVPAEAPIREALPPTSGAWQLDEGDATPHEPFRTWDAAGDESAARRPWILAVVLLVLAALAYGTWSSLQRAETPPNPQQASAGSEVTMPPDGRAADPPADSTREAVPPGGAAPRPVPQEPILPPRAATPVPVPSAVPPIEPPATPAEAPVTAVGRVLIRSSPSGEVRVNGVARGQTPVVLRDLPFGVYTISVTRPGFAPMEQDVTLQASQPVASLSLDLVRQGSAAAAPAGSGPASPPPTPRAAAPAVAAPVATPAEAPATADTGGIFVMSTPAQARLFVDGQAYGSTPAAIPGLTQGAHVVRVEAPGFRPWEGRVAVIAGTRVRVQATLQQEQE